MTRISNHAYIPRRNRKSRAIRRLIGIALLATVIIAVIFGGILIYFYSSSRTIRSTVNSAIMRTDTPKKVFPGQDEVNILLMGRDLDRDPQGRIVQTRGRTDATMLAHIDFRSRSASVLSIPRDTLVHIPGYPGKRRVSYANALGGPELAQDTIDGFLGVHPDYYMLVNFEAFEKAIDVIGGLKINVDKQLDYDDNWGNLHIHLKPGEQVLNGTQAMGFVRYRQSKDGDAESDFVRIGRQQVFLCAVRKKFSSPRTILRIPRVLDTIREGEERNLTPAQIMCLARFIKSLPPDSNIRMETIPTLNDGGVFVQPDMDATRELVQEIF